MNVHTRHFTRRATTAPHAQRRDPTESNAQSSCAWTTAHAVYFASAKRRRARDNKQGHCTRRRRKRRRQSEPNHDTEQRTKSRQGQESALPIDGERHVVCARATDARCRRLHDLRRVSHARRDDGRRDDEWSGAASDRQRRMRTLTREHEVLLARDEPGARGREARRWYEHATRRRTRENGQL